MLQITVYSLFSALAVAAPVADEDEASVDRVWDKESEEVNVDARIIGGKRSKRNMFPYSVSLKGYNPNGGSVYCGGVLVSQNFIMTAASCFNNE